MNQQKQYTYFASTKPIYFEADSLQELAKKLGLTLTTVNTIVLNKKKTSFDDFLQISRVKKEKVETPVNLKKVIVAKSSQCSGIKAKKIFS